MLKATVLVLPLFLLGCNDAPATAGADRPAGSAKTRTSPAALAAITEPQDTQMRGAVVETMDAGQYTYVRLKTSNGDIWAAVSRQALKAGAEITIGNAIWMENFESKTLNKKFEHILFGAIVTPGSAMAGALPQGHPPTTQAAAGVSAGGAAEAKDVGQKTHRRRRARGRRIAVHAARPQQRTARIWHDRAARRAAPSGGGVRERCHDPRGQCHGRLPG